MSLDARNVLSALQHKDMAGRHVLIGSDVAEMIDRAARMCADQPETGGILLGSLRGPHLECTGFSQAGLNDQRGTFHFTRQDAIHQQIANAAWSRSNHTVTFIGEWHTHPMGNPIPSSIDTKSWCALTRRANHPMLFLIAAPSAWRGFLVLPGIFRSLVQPLSIREGGETGIVLG